MYRNFISKVLYLQQHELALLQMESQTFNIHIGEDSYKPVLYTFFFQTEKTYGPSRDLLKVPSI